MNDDVIQSYCTQPNCVLIQKPVIGVTAICAAFVASVCFSTNVAHGYYPIEPKSNISHIVYHEDMGVLRSEQSRHIYLSLPMEGDYVDKIKNFDKLEHYKQLQPNWNGYGALALSSGLLQSVRNVLETVLVQPEIFPTARDSIQFEYEKSNGDYLEFELFQDTMNVLIMTEDEDCEYTEPVAIESINKAVERFYGRDFFTI